MENGPVVSGVVLEEATLSVEELSRVCAVEPHWVIERVEAGLLQCIAGRHFASAALVRARRLRALERNFDANAELAALTVDLIEEVERLRRRLG